MKMKWSILNLTLLSSLSLCSSMLALDPSPSSFQDAESVAKETAEKDAPPIGQRL
jgi:hypothetical protein